jgi:hypothetical protein
MKKAMLSQAPISDEFVSVIRPRFWRGILCAPPSWYLNEALRETVGLRVPAARRFQEGGRLLTP